MCLPEKVSLHEYLVDVCGSSDGGGGGLCASMCECAL